MGFDAGRKSRYRQEQTDHVIIVVLTLLTHRVPLYFKSLFERDMSS